MGTGSPDFLHNNKYQPALIRSKFSVFFRTQVRPDTSAARSGYAALRIFSRRFSGA